MEGRGDHLSLDPPRRESGPPQNRPFAEGFTASAGLSLLFHLALAGALLLADAIAPPGHPFSGIAPQTPPDGFHVFLASLPEKRKERKQRVTSGSAARREDAPRVSKPPERAAELSPVGPLRPAAQPVASAGPSSSSGRGDESSLSRAVAAPPASGQFIGDPQPPPPPAAEGAAVATGPTDEGPAGVTVAQSSPEEPTAARRESPRAGARTPEPPPAAVRSAREATSLVTPRPPAEVKVPPAAADHRSTVAGRAEAADRMFFPGPGTALATGSAKPPPAADGAGTLRSPDLAPVGAPKVKTSPGILLQASPAAPGRNLRPPESPSPADASLGRPAKPGPAKAGPAAPTAAGDSDRPSSQATPLSPDGKGVFLSSPLGEPRPRGPELPASPDSLAESRPGEFDRARIATSVTDGSAVAQAASKRREVRVRPGRTVLAAQPRMPFPTGERVAISHRPEEPTAQPQSITEVSPQPSDAKAETAPQALGQAGDPPSVVAPPGSSGTPESPAEPVNVDTPIVRSDGEVGSAFFPSPGMVMEEWERAVAEDGQGLATEDSLTIEHVPPPVPDGVAIMSPRDGHVLPADVPPIILIEGQIQDRDVSTIWLVANDRRIAVRAHEGRFHKVLPVLDPVLHVWAELPSGGEESQRSRAVTIRAPSRSLAHGLLLLEWPEGVTADQVKLEATWRAHAERLDDPVHTVPLHTFGRSQDNVPPEAFFLRLNPGVYTFALHARSGLPSDVRATLHLPGADRLEARPLKPLSLKRAGEGVLAKVLFPQGVFWDQDEWFSGRSESVDTMTKFRFPEGISWTERKSDLP